MTAVVAIILLALVFDFINGFHDAANSIATVVSTRVLSPRAAVVWAGVFNAIAYFIMPLGVAATVGKGTVDPTLVTPAIIAAGLLGATLWNLLTWWWGLPSSSSHALIGGFAGAAVVRAGFGVLIVPGLVKTAVFIVASPILGFLIGSVVMIAVYWIFRRASPSRVGGLFRRLQLLSAAAYSLGHGGNDAQKTMGLILAVLISAGMHPADADIPHWIVIACYSAMGLGTMMGGWRIVKTMGQKICKLQPVEGFCAETAGAITLFIATHFNIPVSTTHTITGAIVGVGSTRGAHAVKWGVAGRVVWAWVLTIPAAAGAAALLAVAFGLLGWN